MPQLFGAIEAGGTKFICAVGTSPGDLHTRRIPTTTPRETIDRAIAYFRAQPPVAAIGIGSFGPIDLRRDSKTWGCITTTPKPGWANVDLAGAIARALNVPVAFDTDVNVAALGEHRWGAARGIDSFIYLTIGTGIGGGGMASGKLLHGLLHPEMGHIRVPHDFARDPFPGFVPFTAIALKDLRRVRQSKNVGDSAAKIYRSIIRRGNWKRITLHWRWRITFAHSRRNASSSAAA